MSEDNKHINYSAADIEKYQQGKLSAAAMHAMEKAALDDPFLADAMEGFSMAHEKIGAVPYTVENDLTELQQRLADRVQKKQDAAPVIQFSWWKVAAVVFLFLGAGWFYIAVNKKGKDQSLAKAGEARQEAPVISKSDSSAVSAPAAATPPDSLHDVAVLEKNRPAPATHQPSFLKTADQQQRPAAPVTAANSNAQSKIETEEDKSPDSIAAAERKKDAAKPLADQLEQKAQGIASGDDRSAARAQSAKAGYFNNTFAGTVVDQSNRPVPGVTVQIPNLNIATSTDKNGAFSFRSADTTLKVSVASVGYETQTLDLTTNSIESQNNIIRLQPSLLALNEVVVTGYGKQKKQDLKKNKDIIINILDAEPGIPWNDYNAYLEKNKRMPDSISNLHGEVVVAFTVDTKGMLKNIRIKKSFNVLFNAEAIRLIKEGPSWRSINGGKAKVNFAVKF